MSKFALINECHGPRWTAVYAVNSVYETEDAAIAAYNAPEAAAARKALANGVANHRAIDVPTIVGEVVEMVENESSPDFPLARIRTEAGFTFCATCPVQI